MATIKTDVQTGQTGFVNTRVEGQRVSGDIRYAEAVLTLTTALAAADVIEVVTLPIGAIVLPEKSWIASEASGGTGTAISKLGDAADDDRYSATSVSLTSAAYTAVTPAVATSVTTRTPVTKDTTVIKAVVALTSGTVTADKKIVFGIAYRMP